MFDFDLAEMYGVETKVLKQSVRRNIERFPDDFMFELTKKEFIVLRSQFVTSKRGGSRYQPFAFTEQGVAMLSSVLNSKQAIEINIRIMRAFVAMRQLVSVTTPTNRVEELQKQVNELKAYIEDVFTDYNDINEDTRMQLELINRTLAELQVEKKAEKPRRRIGFQIGGKDAGKDE
jgi:phage regulator Rha-like protein